MRGPHAPCAGVDDGPRHWHQDGGPWRGQVHRRGGTWRSESELPLLGGEGPKPMWSPLATAARHVNVRVRASQVCGAQEGDARPQPLPRSTVMQLGLEGNGTVRSLQVSGLGRRFVPLGARQLFHGVSASRRAGGGAPGRQCALPAVDALAPAYAAAARDGPPHPRRRPAPRHLRPGAPALHPIRRDRPRAADRV